MIVIVDYGMGNLRNVVRGFAEVGAETRVTSDPLEVAGAAKVVLPGVGAFGEAIKRIDDLDLRRPIMSCVSRGAPLLGICLGMQLLFERSEESPGVAGLSLLEGEVRKFSGGLKVPHVGWNDVEPVRSSPLLGFEKATTMYFVHSFYVPLCAWTIGKTEYGLEFSSCVQSGMLFGVQFHPEKSQHAGLSILRNFAAFGNSRGENETSSGN
jgi:glutamine amidotransferase